MKLVVSYLSPNGTEAMFNPTHLTSLAGVIGAMAIAAPVAAAATTPGSPVAGAHQAGMSAAQGGYQAGLAASSLRPSLSSHHVSVIFGSKVSRACSRSLTMPR
jgi:hypothetical protein